MKTKREKEDLLEETNDSAYTYLKKSAGSFMSPLSYANFAKAWEIVVHFMTMIQYEFWS